MSTQFTGVHVMIAFQSLFRGCIASYFRPSLTRVNFFVVFCFPVPFFYHQGVFYRLIPLGKCQVLTSDVNWRYISKVDLSNFLVTVRASIM